MPRSHIDGTALAAAVVATGFGFFLLGGPYFWMASIAGLALAIVLLSYDREGARSLIESLGFAAVVSLALALAIASPLAWVRAQNTQSGAFAGPVSGEWLPYVWIGLTILIWAIDRARMSGRVTYTTSAPVQPISLRPAAPVTVPAPEPVRPSAPPSATPTPTPTSTPRATFTQPSFGGSSPEAAPAAPAIVTPRPQPAPEAAPPAPITQTAEPPAPAAPPLPQAVPIPPGKEAMIYVSLVGEGLNVLRAVRAEHLGRDFYKIAEDMPEGETWQFGPGQVVRCRKKNLSSGKAMVAVEEAPRAS